MDYTALIRMALSFAFVLALMLAIAWLARRFKLDQLLQGRMQRKQGALAVKDSLFLDPKRRLVVVAHGEQHFLLLLSAHGDVNLGTVSPTQDSAHATS